MTLPHCRSSRAARAASVAAVAVVIALLAGSAQGGGLPGLLVCDGHGFSVRPATIYYTGDGSGVIDTGTPASP
ncbi:MAG: hypothetical protein M3071_07985 [Actinomycetota bacterium]|nr:hypothetical protein [Actinomycetota bacterium]